MRSSVEGKTLMHFQGKTSVFTFLRRSMYGAKEYVNNFVAYNIFYTVTTKVTDFKTQREEKNIVLN